MWHRLGAPMAASGRRAVHSMARAGFTAESKKDYAAARPSYQPGIVRAAIAAAGACAGLGPAPSARPAGRDTPTQRARPRLSCHPRTGRCTEVVDVGAGTGKLTAILAQELPEASRITAVEPSDMATHIDETIPGVRVVRAIASATTLESESADAIFCGQAFHWFADAPTVAEFARLLRPGGALVLLWNRRNAVSPWMQELEDEITALYPPDVPREQTMQWQAALTDPLSNPGWFVAEEVLSDVFDYLCTRDQLLQFIASLSVVARLPLFQKKVVLTRIAQVANTPLWPTEEDEEGGTPRLILPFVTHVHVFRRTEEPPPKL